MPATTEPTADARGEWEEFARVVRAGSGAAGPLAVLREAGRVVAVRRRLDPDAVDVLLGEPEGAPGAVRPPAAALAPDDLGPLLESLRADPAARKRHGSYYTARALVEPTVARTLRPLLGGALPDVCDPAAGGGVFLLAALRELAAAGGTRAALGRITGIDADLSAVRIARLALWLEAGDPDLDPAEAAARVLHDDALADGWSRAGERFDAVVGNPPWDIHKPDSRRFFAAFDPAHGRRAKQDALRVQRRILREDPEAAALWAQELAAHRAFARRVRSAASPFRHQGHGDLNRYKLFTELAWNLLRPSGRLGLVLPSGIYTDAGSEPLRRLLLEHSRWEWLFGFENRRGLFAIDGRYKFAVVVAEKGGATRAVRTAFMRLDPADWVDAERHALRLPAGRIRTLSPRSLAVPELRDAGEARVLARIVAASHPLGDELDGGLRYRRELDQTLHSHRFATRCELEARGYRADSLGRWRHADGGEAVPLWEGRMIGQFDFSAKGWVRGRGRRAVWRVLPCDVVKPIEPQFLLAADELPAVDPDHARPKIGFMAIASATNARSMVAASLIDAPCGNSVPTLRGPSLEDDLVVLAVLNSFVYDFALRTRLGGTNLNRFVLAETPMLPAAVRREIAGIAPWVAALAWCHPRYDRAWRALGAPPVHAVEPADRLCHRAAIEAVVAAAFGIDARDFERILRDCEHPRETLRSAAFARGLDPKGFWRVDREREPAERLTVRALAAFRGLGAAARSPRAAAGALAEKSPTAGLATSARSAQVQP